MRIGIDVDGVLANIIGPAVKIVNDRLGLELTYEDANWGTWGTSNLTVSAILKILDEVWNNGLVEPMEPDLRSTLRYLQSANHEVIVITRRTRPSHPAMVQWLQDEGLRYDSLILVGVLPKLDYPIDVLIDDHPDVEVMAASWPDKRVAVRDQPWNRGCAMSDNAYRVSSVAEFARTL